MRLVLAWLLLFAILGGALWVALWVDRNIVEPAVSRASARALGITVEEYRRHRSEFWRSIRARIRL